jgi:hypothetical protein
MGFAFILPAKYTEIPIEGLTNIAKTVSVNQDEE